MKYILIIVLAIAFTLNTAAQATKTSTKNFVFKINKQSGKIDLFNGSEAIGSKFKVNKLELEIFDTKGEYAGTLDLKTLTVPKEEISSYEKLKIAALVLTDNQTGEQIRINDVAVLEH